MDGLSARIHLDFSADFLPLKPDQGGWVVDEPNGLVHILHQNQRLRRPLGMANCRAAASTLSHAIGVKAADPAMIVSGICASGADCMLRSFESGEVVTTNSAQTIADGIAVRLPVPQAVEDMRGIVDQVRTVSDQRIIEAMRLLYSLAGLLIEPAGAAGLAAILDSASEFADKHIAVVLCGGNLTETQIRDWIIS